VIRLNASRSMSETITIHLNGKDREVPAGLTVAGLLESLDLNEALVVVELNREILDRARYAEAPVEAGDRVELVHFVGGG
jgi:thiamine biosynthesis protein ThiS